MTDLLSGLGISLGSSSPRETAHEFVRETLRRAILNGDLPGGTRLIQAEVARELNVSTTPVREALRDLDAEGLVRLDAHRGGIVHELSSGELSEIFGLRSLLEPAAMRRAASRISASEVDRVERIHTQMIAAPQSSAWVTLNREFHLAIYEASESPRLVQILGGLLDASVIYVSAGLVGEPANRDVANHDHSEMIDALRANDVEAAVASVEHHLEIVKTYLDDPTD